MTDTRCELVELSLYESDLKCMFLLMMVMKGKIQSTSIKQNLY